MNSPDSVFTATSGGAKLIASGTVIPFDNGPVSIGIPMGDGELVLTVSFISNEDKQSRWDVRPDPDKPTHMGLVMSNFNMPFGGGPVEPIRLWRNPQFSIWGLFRFYSHGSSTNLIQFSFYMKDDPIEVPK